MKLLIAADFSQGSKNVIDSIKNRPWPAGSEACVLHVVDVLPFPLGAEIIETVRRSADSVAKSIGECLEPSGLKIRTDISLGSPRSAISEYARNWGADLIVVGSHGWRGSDRSLMGSVSESVALHAHCSVEVIR